MNPPVVVLMAGGMGTRLWPVSTVEQPKQFQALVGQRTLLESTVARASQITTGTILTFAGQRHDALARAQVMSETNTSDVLVETSPIGTAALIAIAACHVEHMFGPQTPVVILPVDHAIGDEAAWNRDLETAIDVCRSSDGIVVLGVKPTEPSSSFGYITLSGSMDDTGSAPVAAFLEKPDRSTATELVGDGALWNCGVFVSQAGVLTQAFQTHQPAMLAFAKAQVEAGQSAPLQPLPDEIPAIAFDYAIMQDVLGTRVVPHSGSWSDLGTWAGVHAYFKSTGALDVQGNYTRGPVHIAEGASSNIVISDVDGIGVAPGVNNLAIIQADGQKLVMPLSDATSVRDIGTAVSSLAANDWRNQSPWGTWRTLHRTDGFQIKRIRVNHGESLSIQRHVHRAEHWIVTQGVATVSVDGVTKQYQVGEHAYIPAGSVHALANLSQAMLEIVEVQIGDDLAESDIERFSDPYGRKAPPEGQAKTIDIAVFGAGYVGLSTAVTMALAGHRVTAYEIDDARAQMVRDGVSPIPEPGMGESLTYALQTGRLTVAHPGEFHKNAWPDATIVCVNTPNHADGSLDVSTVISVIETVAECADGRRQAIVIKSTVPVGTGKSVEAQLSSTAGAQHLALWSYPEFLREGKAVADSVAPDRVVVGGDWDHPSHEVITALLGRSAHWVSRLIRVTRESAELTKMVANAMLATRAALTNEAAQLAVSFGVDPKSLLEAVGKDPRIGSSYLTPSPYVGGPCLQKDARGFEAVRRDLGLPSGMLGEMITSNESHIRWCVDQMIERLSQQSVHAIALWGLGFKPDSADTRNAAAPVVVDVLADHGVTDVRAWDPHVPEHEWFGSGRYVSDPLTSCQDADALIVIEFGPKSMPDKETLQRISVSMKHPMVIDIRADEYRKRLFEDSGFVYQSIL